MATRVIIRGQVGYWSAGGRGGGFFKPGVLVDSKPIPVERAMPAAGETYDCPEDGLTYRVLAKVDLQRECWGTAGFWCRRLRCTFDELREMTLHGIFDAVLELGSPAKRFRVRDEARAKQWLIDYRAKVRAAAKARLPRRAW